MTKALADAAAAAAVQLLVEEELAPYNKDSSGQSGWQLVRTESAEVLVMATGFEKGSAAKAFITEVARAFHRHDWDVKENVDHVSATPKLSGLWIKPTLASDVTYEMVTLAVDVVDGWYSEGRIDWDDVWDRLDGSELEDGTKLDLGDGADSMYALAQIKKEVQQRRKNR